MADEDEIVSAASRSEHLGLQREPVVRAPLLEAYNLDLFRAIANGATPVSSKTFSAIKSHFDQNPRMFGVTVYDDSMSGLREGLHSGDIAIVNPDVPWAPGNLIIAIAPGRGRVLIRQIRAINTEDGNARHITLAMYKHSLPSLETYSGGENELLIIGKVTHSFRSY